MNQYRRWSYDDQTKNAEDLSLAINRIWKDSANIKFTPKFKINKDDNFFTLGSCFARELETGLLNRGYSVLSRPSIIPSDLFEVRNGVASQDFYNRYNLASMHQEILNLTIGNDALNSDSLIYINNNGLYDDCHYTPALTSATLEVVKKRRETITLTLAEAIKNSQIVVITLGLCEAWQDTDSDSYLNVISSPFMLKKYSNRLKLQNLNFIDCVKHIDGILNLLSDKKVILTVSPVPLTSTFNNQDVVIANHAAKSILRAVAQYATTQYDNVDYFPSYEMVSYSEPRFAWKSDGRHVSRSMVDNIINLAITSYLD